jgi:multidrug efflux pump subunit AcrA (membrane-fusion protein)
MLHRTSFLSGWLFLVCCYGAYASDSPAPIPPTSDHPAPVAPVHDQEKVATRNNAASLLFQLVEDEKNVSFLLIFKGNRPEVNSLVKAISVTAGDASKNLLAFAKADPSLDLHATELPAGEIAARAAIAKTKTHQLLLSTGDNFEFALLLTQADALSYGYNLAQTALDNSSDPAEKQMLSALRDTMKNQYLQIIAFIRGPAK